MQYAIPSWPLENTILVEAFNPDHHQVPTLDSQDAFVNLSRGAMGTHVHLLLLIHGMWGHPGHVAQMEHFIRERHDADDGQELVLFVSRTNAGEYTYDGMDWGAERVAKELFIEIERLRNLDQHVDRFSVVGYSLGGLVARYLIGILHDKHFFENVIPVHFDTIATPHIGLATYKNSRLYDALAYLGPRLCSRTGEQMYAVDKWSPSGRSLLEAMARPDSVFYQALSLFKRRRLYSNAINDLTVPFVSSAIETYDPFIDILEEFQPEILQMRISTKYPPLIDSITPVMNEALVVKSQKPRRAWYERAQILLRIPLDFPYNAILYILTPILIPVFIVLGGLFVILSVFRSRYRIKVLHGRDQDSLLRALLKAEIDVPNDKVISTSVVMTGDKQPILTPTQRKMVESLNKLTFEKNPAYFPGVRNAHSVIICRDAKWSSLHKRGVGVLAHWADNFEV
ncbi:lipid particle protein [Moniliophthora roreri MCA 2997]|uniref:Lipid particle protein n=1 Tax=Moniliophthora roreri (strain MCA 2997) TaxID=1381753 RepID=V2XS72_MONRO|nr:lipid particle protein [Moniliophthora roreri MCA 2997]